MLRSSRRGMLTGAVTALGGAALGVGVTLSRQQDGSAAPPDRPAAPQDPTPSFAASPDDVAVYGPTQAGIARPTTPQPFGLITVGDLESRGELDFLPRLGMAINNLITDPPADLLPDGPVSLTVTVGLGPRILASRRPDWPGGEALPSFAHDQSIDQSAQGGDLLLAGYAADPNVLAPVLNRLQALIAGYQPRWSQRCYRGPGQGTIARNPLGFYDNIQVPHSAEELTENVWLDQPLAGGTICVVRRLRLDIEKFHAQPVDRQERIIGRHLDGSPLSGGEPFSVVNVEAKTPAGEYLIPAHAHVRAAHPSFTGSHLMLRRGYGYDNGGGDAGLMFICFQRDLRTFVATQRRLDDMDDLMKFVTPTASATFLILPGYSERTGLGKDLL